jgi:CPA2 family monovalent cation:H+ antiporter-2
MALTPFVLLKLDKISYFIMRSRLIKKMNRPLDKVGKKAREIENPTETLEDHLIIIGYGLNGRNLSRAAKSAGIKYVIVELNADTVKEESKKGEPIHFGDAVSGHVLHHIHAEKARVAVVAISDPVSTKRIVQQLRSINPSLHLIVRTRFVAEMEENYKLGANAVIPEEFETSIEIFTRVLNKYFIPNASINEFIQKIRSANYEMLRDIPGAGGLDRISAQIPEMNVTAIRVLKGKNEVVGKTMKESQVRNKFHVTIIALKREDETYTELGGDTVIKCDDILYVMGRPQKIEDFSRVVAGVER